MANPPITIGPFTNVPAPGSPIRSDWAQQITHYVTNLARITGGYRANALAVTLAATDQVLSPTLTIPNQTGWGLVIFQCQLNVTAAPAGITLGVQGNAGAQVAAGVGGPGIGAQQLFAVGLLNMTGAGDQGLFAYGRVNPGGAQCLSQGQLMVLMMGNVPA